MQRITKSMAAVALVAMAAGAWSVYPRLQLRLAARALSNLPVTSAPILLRIGNSGPTVPGQPATRGTGLGNTEAYRAAIHVSEAEQRLGETADSACLKARLLILDGKEDEALEKSLLSARLYPRSACVVLVTGLAYASRGARDGRARDYVLAAESFLRAESDFGVTGPELWSNLGTIFAAMPAPHAAIQYWRRAVEHDPSPEWRKAIAIQQREWEARIAARRDWEAKLDGVAPRELPKGGVEVLLYRAIGTWLMDPARFALPLDRLSRHLRDELHDPWLTALLSRSPAEAKTALSTVFTAHRAGRHGDALKLALAATLRASDEPASLAIRVELAMAQSRAGNPLVCLATINGVRERAARLSYRWLENRAWIEELNCKTQARTVDVMEERLAAARQIAKSGYEGLSLRAQAVLTDPFRSLTTSAEAWQDAHRLLHQYWQGLYAQPAAVTFYVSQALASNLMGQPKTSALLIGEAVDAMGDHPNRKLRADLWSDLADSELRHGRFAPAAQFYRLASEVLPDSDDARRFRLLAKVSQVSADVEQGRSANASTLLRNIEQEAPFPYQRFEYLDRLRLLPAMGSILLKMGRQAEALRHYEVAVNECRERMKLVKDRAQRQALLRESEDAWRGMARAQIKSGNTNAALRYWQLFRGGRDPGDRLIAPAAGATWLSYAVFGDGVALWAADAAGVDYRWLPAGNLSIQTDRLRALLSNVESPPAEIDRLSAHLYHELLQPVRSRIENARTLVIDADQWVAGVPWNVLRDHTGKVLIERHAIAGSYGWQDTSQRMGNEPRRIEPALVVADPELGREEERRYRPLPDARAEAASLSRKLRGAKVLIGRDAKLGMVRDTLAHYHLLHFAGHGVSNGGFGALLLSPDVPNGASLLSAQQIAALDLSELHLAVLGACSSGVGELGGILDLDSLVRSFLEAGTGAVVAAQWNIASRVSADLMDSFYDELLKGTSSAEALRQAALATRAQPRTAHPYYWAAFQVSGRP